MKGKKLHFESLKADGFVDTEAIFRPDGHFTEEAKDAITRGRDKLDPLVVKKIDSHGWCKQCNQELEELKKSQEVRETYKKQDLPLGARD